MQLIPTITFRGVRRTRGIERDVLARLRSLERYYPRITGCRVLIEPVQRHHESGNRYHVRIDLTMPGGEIVANHEAGAHATAKDVQMERLRKREESDSVRKHVHVAIHEAFDVARRQLQDAARRRREFVRTPPEPALAAHSPRR